MGRYDVVVIEVAPCGVDLIQCDGTTYPEIHSFSIQDFRPIGQETYAMGETLLVMMLDK